MILVLHQYLKKFEIDESGVLLIDKENKQLLNNPDSKPQQLSKTNKLKN
jgi:hypothetical protein